MSDLSAIIDIKADASGVEAGIGSAKKSIAGFKGAVIDAGAAASGALEKSGDGGRIASKKVEDATKNIVGSIQRQIAATEAGAKSGADYYRALAGQRGIDVNGLKPYLDQLDAAKAKTLEAATANESFNASLSNLKTVAIAAGAALGAFALFAKKINDGVDAINDLKDATGASIENISALEDIARRTGGSFETVATTLIKFNQALNGAKEGSDAERAFKALGLSVKELKELDPAEAVRETAIALSGFADDGNKARLSQEILGKSLKEVAAYLKDLAENGALVATVTTKQAEEAEKFNKELFKMQKNVTDVSRSLVGPLVESINEVIKKFKEGRAAGESFFAIASRRYVDNVRDFYGMAPANTGGATGSFGDPLPPPTKPSLPDISSPPKAARSGGGAAKTESEYARLIQSIKAKTAATEAEYEGGKKLNDAEKMRVELLGKMNAGLIKLTATEKQNLLAAVQAYDVRLKDTEAAKEALALAVQRQQVRAKESEGIEAYVRAQTDAQVATVKAANDAVTAAQFEFDTYGKSKSQLAELTLARLQDKLAGVSAGTEIAKSIEAQIDAQKRLIGILSQGEARDAGEKAAKATADEWQKTADSINNGLTDSLFRAFESGKGFFKSFWDGIKNLFKTTVLKLAIQGVVGGVMGGTGGIASAASSLLGGGGAGGLSGIGNLLGSGVASAITGGLSAGFGGLAGSIGSLFGAAGTGATLGGSLSAGSIALGAGNIAGGLATIVGALGPIALGIGAVASLLMGKQDKRFGSQYEYVAGSETRIAGGPNKGVDYGNQKQAQDVVIGTINSLLMRVGSSQQVGNFASGFESSEKGKGFSYAGGTFANGVTFGQGATGLGFQNNRGSKTPEQAIAEYKDELIQATLQALQAATDLPKVIADQLKDVNIDALSGDALKNFAAAIDKQITEVESFRTAVQGLPFAALRDLSFDAAAGLIAAGGGLEALSSKLGAYYENFYGEEEKRAQTIASINAATAGSGLDAATATRASFRAIVEAQDLTTEAGRKTYASLIGVAGAFAGITPAVEAAVVGISDTLKSLQKESEGLDVSLLRAQGDPQGADKAQYKIDTAGLSAAEKAVFDYNAGIRAQIAVLDAAKTAAESLATSLRNFASERGNLEANLLAAQGDDKGAAELRRTQAVAGLTAVETAAYDYNRALEAQIIVVNTAKAAAEALATSLRTFASERGSLEANLLAAQGDDKGASKLRREQAVAGLSAVEIAAYDYNRALEAQIVVFNTAKTASEALAQSLRTFAAERGGLEANLLDAQGDSTGATALRRTQAIAGLSAVEIAAYDYNRSIEAQIVVLNTAKTAVLALAQSLRTFASERSVLEADLLDAQGNKGGASEARRAIAITGLSGAEIAAYDFNAALRKTITELNNATAAADTLASTNRGLADRLAVLKGTETDRSLALRDATDETTKSLLRQIYAQEDLNTETKAATETALKALAIAQQRGGLEIRILELQGRSAEALTAKRKIELNAMDASLRPLQELIYGLEDVASAAEKGAQDLAKSKEKAAQAGSTALTVLGNSINEAKNASKAAFDAQIAIINAQKTSAADAFKAQQNALQSTLKAAGDSVSKLSNLTSALQSTINGLQLPGSEAANRKAGQQQINEAIARAKSTGVLPEAESLRNALSAVSAPSQDQFGSSVDFERDFLLTKNSLIELNDITKTQLSAADQTVVLLQTMIETGQTQYDELIRSYDDAGRFAQEQYEAQSMRLDESYKLAESQLSEALGTKLAVLGVADAVEGVRQAVLGINLLNAPPATVQPVIFTPTNNIGSGGLQTGLQALEGLMTQMITAQQDGNVSAQSTASALQGQQTRPLLVEIAA